MAGDFRFSYLLIKHRKVSGSDDTRKSVLIHMGDNTAMDMDSGELHIISSWDDEDEDDEDEDD